MNHIDYTEHMYHAGCRYCRGRSGCRALRAGWVPIVTTPRTCKSAYTGIGGTTCIEPRTGDVIVLIIGAMTVMHDASDIAVFCRLWVVTGTRDLRERKVIAVVGPRARVGL